MTGQSRGLEATANAMLLAEIQVPTHMTNGTRLAAVDLGSNSFRLEIGRIDHGQFYRTEYLKETVRQGGGLDDDRNLTPEAMQRGWDCLARFGERLAGFNPNQVRAVATQTLREARNRDEFLSRANKVLGFPINIIAGREEARLIYLGVAEALPQSDERRLVIDIGGRSTELILGQGHSPQVMESFRVGSIAWSTRYFPDQQFTPHAFQMAEIAAKAVLDEAMNIYRRDTWDMAYGSAGTVNAVGDVLAASGWPAGLISREGLDWLLGKLLSAQSADRLRLPGLKDDRRPIMGGGLSIVRALFDLLQIDEVVHATGGLRHGLLYDLTGREKGQTDVRAQSIQRLASKFGTDRAHAERVAKAADHFLGCLWEESRPPGALFCEKARQTLGWAAQLHEIGSHVSHSDHHKHGAYILNHADAMGFSISELQELSMLVLGQKGKMKKLPFDFENDGLMHQVLALRLAVAVCHARRDPEISGLTLSLDPIVPRRFNLTYPVSWAESFPQSAYLLREEAVAWQRTPWVLTVTPT